MKANYKIRCSPDKLERTQKYLETLEDNRCDTVSFNSIRSKNHQIYSINQVKMALSRYDNKRYYLDKVNSLPYGHYSIS